MAQAQPDPDVADGYPSSWVADVVLRDGSTMQIRPIRPEDAEALQRFHTAQSAQSIYFRFFAPMDRLSERDLYRFTHVDHHDRVALVLVQGEEIRAVGRFDVIDPGVAEVAFNVADSEHGRGLGSVLLEHLAAAGRELGVHRFVADVLPGNAKMIRVFTDAGYDVERRLEDGIISVSFSIEETERSWRVMAERERHAEALSMRGVLQAASVLVLALGPPGEEGQVLAAAVARSLLASAFTGPVHLVGLPPAGPPPAGQNDPGPGDGDPLGEYRHDGGPGEPAPPRVGEGPAGEPEPLADVRLHHDLAEVSGPADLAVVAGPPAEVVAAVPALASLGVRALVVLSHGFGERGQAGMAVQRDLLRATRAAGIRIVGPASYGVVGHGPHGRYNASLWFEAGPGGGAPTPLPGDGDWDARSWDRHQQAQPDDGDRGTRPPGRAQPSSPDGDERTPDGDQPTPDGGAAPITDQARGLGLFGQSAAAGLALRSTASRRRLPVASFLSAGHRVDVSGNDTMQLWSTDPRTAVGALYLESIGNPRKFSRIARHLSASTPLVAVVSGQTGQASPPGHAVRTSSQPRRVLTEMLRQAGVVGARSVREMLDVAGLLLAQPLPAGPRTAILSSSAALAGLVAEVLRSHGLDVAGEPVTLPPLAGAADYAAALDRLTVRTDFDAVVVAHAPVLGTTDTAVAGAIAQVAARDGRTWVATAYGLHGLTPELTAAGRTVPSMTTVEDAVTALARALDHARWRSRAADPLVDPPGTDPAGARDLLAAPLTGLPRGRRQRLPAEAAAELLARYGIEVVPATVVADAAEAVAAAERIGWPVALKVADEVLRHRTDLGGVRLDLADADMLTEAVEQMRTRAERVLGRPVRFEVQAMAPPGVACVVRGTEDELYGPVVAFGLAGDATELLGDVAYRIPPLTAADVSEMVRSVAAAPRLLGYRGLPRSDVAALEDLLARLSLLTDDLPEVAEVTLNPVIVGEEGLHVASAAVTVARPARQDAGRRALPAPPGNGPGPAGGAVGGTGPASSTGGTGPAGGAVGGTGPAGSPGGTGEAGAVGPPGTPPGTGAAPGPAPGPGAPPAVPSGTGGAGTEVEE